MADHVAFASAYPIGLWYRLTTQRRGDRVPLKSPATSLGDVRAASTKHLPDAAIRRRLMWRYTLVYRPLVSSLSPWSRGGHNMLDFAR